MITNPGDQEWNRDIRIAFGLESGMFNPSCETTVFMPCNPDGEGIIYPPPVDRLRAGL